MGVKDPDQTGKVCSICPPCLPSSTLPCFSVTSSSNYVFGDQQMQLTVSALQGPASGNVISSAATTLTLNDASNFPSSGNGKLCEGNSITKISWTGKTSNQLTGVTGHGTPAKGTTLKLILDNNAIDESYNTETKIFATTIDNTLTPNKTTIFTADWNRGEYVGIFSIEDEIAKIFEKMTINTIANTTAPSQQRQRALTIAYSYALLPDLPTLGTEDPDLLITLPASLGGKSLTYRGTNDGKSQYYLEEENDECYLFYDSATLAWWLIIYVTEERATITNAWKNTGSYTAGTYSRVAGNTGSSIEIIDEPSCPGGVISGLTGSRLPFLKENTYGRCEYYLSNPNGGEIVNSAGTTWTYVFTHIGVVWQGVSTHTENYPGGTYNRTGGTDLTPTVSIGSD